MPVSVTLPPFVMANSAAAVTAACYKAIHDEDDVDIDARQVKFVDPFGMAVLGATFFTIRAHGAAVRVSGLQADIGGYLQRMDVFDGVALVDCDVQGGRRSNRSDVLMELTRLNHTARSDDTAYQLAKSLVGHIPGIDLNAAPDKMTGFTPFDQLVVPLQYVLSELLENALTHARRHGHGDACVWVASQYYPSKDLVRLGVVDNGCSFLKSLRGHPELKSESHLDAILTALRPRVSCNRDLGLRTDSVNQGVGLTTTCRIAEHSGGGLVIVSGDGMHNTSGRSLEMRRGCYWQGVGIALEFRRNLLKDIRIRELLPVLDTQPPIRLRFE